MTEKIWRKSKIDWALALAYTASIFAFGPLVVPVWRWLTRTLSATGAVIAVDRAVLVIGLVAAGLFVAALRVKRPAAYPWLAAVLCAYAYLLTLHCEYPVERVHLLQYCFLAWLYHRAARHRLSEAAAYFAVAAAVFTVGTCDELVQGLIPNRSSTLADMVTNWAAGGLGLAGLIAARPGGPWKWYEGRGGGLRITLGYAIPVAAVIVLSHQVYTRYIAPPMNLFIITVDCLRPDRLGAYGYERKTSPNIDAFASEGVLFKNMYSQAAWTGPGVVSTLTGLYPPTHGVVMNGATLPKSVTTLLDAFAERGYRTPNLSYLTVVPNFQNLGANETSGIDVTKLDEIQSVHEWINQNHRDPFAIWYHWRHIHLPYDPPDRFRRFSPANDLEATPPETITNIIQKEVIIPYKSVEFSEEEKAWTQSLYDAQIRQFDAAMAGIRHRLSLHHILDNTLIVITADHGEELFEHGFVGHASTAVHSQHYEEHLRIPLILYAPKLLPKGVEIDTMAQQVDILPTVFDLMGWPIPEEVQGRSLVPAIGGEAMADVPLFAESVEGGYQAKEDMKRMRVRSVRTREWKLVTRTSPEGESFALYDLVRDPMEQHNSFEENPGQAGTLYRQLAQWISDTEEAREALVERERVLAVESYVRADPSTLEVPTILEPAHDSVIGYASSGGAVKVKWTGNPNAAYIIEYHVGEGWHTLKGKVPVVGTEKVFGPLPRDGWKPLYQWNPYRIRIRPRDLRDGWSEWISATVEPLE